MSPHYKYFRLRSLSFAVFVFLLSSVVSLSQTNNSNPTDAKALSSWIALDAPPGWEHLATDILLKQLTGWQRDQSGNLFLLKGSGSPRRVLACALDRPGFAVTEIIDTGYLRMREVGSLRPIPLWIQFHEGQRIRVITRNGSVPGVVTVKSTHLQRGRTANAPVTSLDDLWIDVGATSRSDVQRLGIQILDPIVRDLPSWSYGNFVAGPTAALRIGCAAVASAARSQVQHGETIFLLTTLRSFGNDGLEASLRKLGHVDEVTIIEPSDGATDQVSQRKVEKPPYLPNTTGISSVTILSTKTRFPGSLVESVDVGDANALLAAVERAADVQHNEQVAKWIQLPVANPISRTSPNDLFSSTAMLLKALADVPAVSGHEAKMRQAIIQALPAWAKQQIITDAEGNLVLEVGPDRDEPVMFVAHQDEVGFEITSIAADGTVSLRNRGGLFASLWEGQPALLHFDAATGTTTARPPLSGVFVPRSAASTKQPEALTGWFGVDASELKRLGVAVGQSLTAYKDATRIGATRFTARALDDRAGSTALILAVKRLNPSLLNHRVVFAWSVREEVGLEGAMALARRYGSSLKRVYSIDTFVSSDSPAESTRFAFAPLGEGAVIRGLDSSSVATPADTDRIMRTARLQRIPLQVGATNGGADGSDFVRYGVLHVGLSWPGRYSHSPVEVLDLRDLQSLERLIYALATSN